ncbi:hypothetical protein FHR32_007806 [Streptosporangium album]|uniref:Resolvase/invertase-type recombinase catalytic domain-containing protein n=1 Tax=Streptosporangium album TaxID=47479 RepID=A0A7W7S5N9_9ACTN|nr:hypothetical protein [Streptosporangium album]MBB4943406.1 hypothetical protein [Streptosporangium album]
MGTDHHLSAGVTLGYARGSTTRQSLERQLDALTAATPQTSEYSRLLKVGGAFLGKIATKTGTPRTSLHCYLATSDQAV